MKLPMAVKRKLADFGKKKGSISAAGRKGGRMKGGGRA